MSIIQNSLYPKIVNKQLSHFNIYLKTKRTRVWLQIPKSGNQGHTVHGEHFNFNFFISGSLRGLSLGFCVYSVLVLLFYTRKKASIGSFIPDAPFVFSDMSPPTLPPATFENYSPKATNNQCISKAGKWRERKIIIRHP